MLSFLFIYSLSKLGVKVWAPPWPLLMIPARAATSDALFLDDRSKHQSNAPMISKQKVFIYLRYTESQPSAASKIHLRSTIDMNTGTV